jgi:hypothetical protein
LQRAPEQGQRLVPRQLDQPLVEAVRGQAVLLRVVARQLLQLEQVTQLADGRGPLRIVGQPGP